MPTQQLPSGKAMKDAADNKQKQRRRKEQSWQRAEVLDSSDEDDCSVNDTKSPARSSISQSSSAITMITQNTRRGSEKSEATDSGNTSDTEDEDDDAELMNPYVMNPFNGNSRLDYTVSALLPPSVEMAPMGSRSEELPMQQQRFPQQQPQGESSTLLRSPPRTHSQEKTTLAGFDPYSPKQQTYELEMEEEEESIEFLSPARNNSSNTRRGGSSLGGSDGSAEGSEEKWNVFGPLLNEPSAPSPLSKEGCNENAESFGFSPFPKHRHAHSPNEYVTASGEGYGEGTPLSSRHGKTDYAASAAAGSARVPSSGIMGIAHALINVFKAILSSFAYSVNSLLYGAPSQTNNPFSAPRRLNVRMQQRRRWGMLSYFRLFAVTLAVLFCVGTMTALWNVPNAGEVGVDRVEKRVYQRNSKGVRRGMSNEEGGSNEMSEVGHRPSSIVLNKMKKAKQHWWNKNKVQDDRQPQPHMEVYHNGEKEGVVGAAETLEVPQQHQQQQTDVSQQQHQQQQQQQAVIVQTEEDGTLLIKLPPPKAQLETPKARMNAPPLGSSLNAAESDGDETMYIKLPYPQQQQQQQRRTLAEIEEGTMKQELEPPLRGAAPQPHRHSNPLTRRPPLPLSDITHHRHAAKEEEQHPGVLHALRNEFEGWMNKHGKKYESHEEKERRFSVWRRNHFRIKEKNEKHGPCRMTGKAVFGHNLFSDLDPEEFQSKFLTGYRGPRHHDDQHGHKEQKIKKGDGDSKSHSYFRETQEAPPPLGTVKRHPTIQRKLEDHTAMYGGGDSGPGKSRLHGSKYQANFTGGCQWWDVSCLLRWIFSYQYIGGTREPVYDESSYPSALDWRTFGVVTDVHSQGSCGACWAITAVETIESANAIATGQLMDLAEEEVIACDGTCEMCNGGWPQNAYEYVMKHGGLPAKTSEYDADWLYTVTAVLGGESYEASDYDMGNYFAQTCPAGKREGGEGGSGSSKSRNSGDQYGYEYGSYVETTRYGKVKGYGYATDRCICYTDGSGCDCDDQDEKTAVLNVASYGPAAVCLEASLWQDYEGGIMTEDIGCSKSFLDMNHCVEVVGYAFTDGSESDGEEGERENNNSGSGSNDRSNKSGGSRDNQWEGYWIVKNQWSNYWGMNGYAYIAMGANTCGILNDMTQVYMS